MIRSLIFVSVSLLACRSHASENALQKSLEAALDPLEKSDAWNDFVKNHPKQFPEPDIKDPIVITVEPHQMELDGDTKTIGFAYRQLWVHANPKRLEKILTSPEIFHVLYDLDRDAVVPGEPHQGHIFKKVPVLSNQDYTLNFVTTEEPGRWLTRARQIDDPNEFAVRDNLLNITSLNGGALFREVSTAYIRSRFLRMLGPQVRSVTASEVTAITRHIRCFAEKDPESLTLDQEQARDCVHPKQSN